MFQTKKTSCVKIWPFL